MVDKVAADEQNEISEILVALKKIYIAVAVLIGSVYGAIVIMLLLKFIK